MHHPVLTPIHVQKSLAFSEAIDLDIQSTLYFLTLQAQMLQQLAAKITS